MKVTRIESAPRFQIELSEKQAMKLCALLGTTTGGDEDSLAHLFWELDEQFEGRENSFSDYFEAEDQGEFEFGEISKPAKIVNLVIREKS